MKISTIFIYLSEYHFNFHNSIKTLNNYNYQLINFNIYHFIINSKRNNRTNISNILKSHKRVHHGISRRSTANDLTLKNSFYRKKVGSSLRSYSAIHRGYPGYPNSPVEEGKMPARNTGGNNFQRTRDGTR